MHAPVMGLSVDHSGEFPRPGSSISYGLLYWTQTQGGAESRESHSCKQIACVALPDGGTTNVAGQWVQSRVREAHRDRERVCEDVLASQNDVGGAKK